MACCCKISSCCMRPLMVFGILALIYIIAFATRLFSVIRFESVIHEFDPYFNFRTTKFLANEGFYNFHNWFDDRAWYPLGRIIGGTIYPGLMLTAAAASWMLEVLTFPMNIRNVCVFLAPWMSSNTAIATFFLTKEVMIGEKVASDSIEDLDRKKKMATQAGILSAFFVAIVPGYISRSVAGSYDNEGVAIFALIITYYFWVKGVHTGSFGWILACVLAYFYMVAAWGGYIFIINLIPLFTLVLLVTGRYSNRLYIAYSTFYILGTLVSMQIPFVGFQPVFSSEHLAAMGTFGLLQLWGLIRWVKGLLPKKEFEELVNLVILAGVAVLAIAVVVGTLTGYIAPWTGRFYSLLDPTYAKDHIPIIASVSEHQPTTWASFFFDLHCLSYLLPAGLYFCFKKPSDGKIFMICYGVTSVYFAGVMIRLILVLAPIACILGSIAVTETLESCFGVLKEWYASSEEESVSPAKVLAKKKQKIKKSKKKDSPDTEMRVVSLIVASGMTLVLCMYAVHCVWVTSEAYSSPSIVLGAKQPGGGQIIFDDFREAYYWLRQNTEDDAKVMSWWDYGYQISGMANRTVLVDNNTWNNTHIATVGRAMASTEANAYPIMRSLDVDYVLVIFGALTGYASDDINKFLWMVRIGGGVYPGEISEKDYFGGGQYRVDGQASPVMLDSMMYKMCYYRFGEISTMYDKPAGYDRVREVEIGRKHFELTHLEESFTSEHWLVRIYKVKKEENLEAPRKKGVSKEQFFEAFSKHQG